MTNQTETPWYQLIIENTRAVAKLEQRAEAIEKEVSQIKSEVLTIKQDISELKQSVNKITWLVGGTFGIASTIGIGLVVPFIGDFLVH